MNNNNERPDKGMPMVKNNSSQYVDSGIQEKSGTNPKVIRGGDLRSKESFQKAD